MTSVKVHAEALVIQILQRNSQLVKRGLHALQKKVWNRYQYGDSITLPSASTIENQLE
jgi:hypothetical protein